ncbi:hypothetical protein [Youngiibacter multivorans]|uniref:Uncharacterized protein n=1 Tax=Youngiibacter multivorans TaxID=937251 RepID=A0ABS4FZZ2_9CLOT|nr:hypothetical protein [Youngiibacter multivorans]MBP1917863.1 hypothetical protein [Youngiibacter multivorans]
MDTIFSWLIEFKNRALFSPRKYEELLLPAYRPNMVYDDYTYKVEVLG